MKRTLLTALTCVLLLGVASLSHADDVEAEAVFEQLKSLAGTWKGEPDGEGETETEAEEHGEVVHEFRVSAAGTVVMEIMGPDSDHEMINMYHIDGEDLLLTHYCAGGNQPQMRLDREASSAETLVFDFAGGTNLDPAVDQHIHAAEITLLDEDRIRSSWDGYNGGARVATMTFHLGRSE